MKFSDLIASGRADPVIYELTRHTETVRSLLIASGDRAEHYLLWTNGGAAIALLSFMAASDKIRSAPAAWWALICFAAGVVSCGLLCAVNYQVRLKLFQVWIDDSTKFFKDQIDAANVYDNLNRIARSRWSFLPAALGYVAFIWLIAGIAIAFLNFRPEAAVVTTAAHYRPDV